MSSVIGKMSVRLTILSCAGFTKLGSGRSLLGEICKAQREMGGGVVLRGKREAKRDLQLLPLN